MIKLLNQFSDFIKPCDISWAVCGGIAIDLFIGKQTREHKDLDISVGWNEKTKIIDFMLDNNWNIYEPDNGKLRQLTKAEDDLCTSDNIWCLSADNDSYTVTHLHGDYFDIVANTNNQSRLDFVEFLFNKIENGSFIYKRNKNIMLSTDKAVLYSDDIPYLAPELVLLYKSTFIRYLGTSDNNLINMIDNYRHDFNTVINHLTNRQTDWLQQSMVVEYHDNHEWIKYLKSM